MILSKKCMGILLLSFISFFCYAQEQPVKWNFFSKKIADKQYELHLVATIKPGWHIYSSKQPKDAIGLPTSINITTNPLLSFPGKPEEKGELKKVKNEVLDSEDYLYYETVEFVRPIKVKVNAKTNVAGSVEFMACTDQKCLPPETVTFNLSLQ